MADLGLVALGLIIAGGVLVGLLTGYLMGSRLGGGKSSAVREAAKQHDEYKHEVREHFEQTSQIMSRMVDDYREMYQHLSAGAGKLANIHPERVITPPPAPEAITAEPAGDTGTAGSRHDGAPEESNMAKPVSTGSLAEDEAGTSAERPAESPSGTGARTGSEKSADASAKAPPEPGTEDEPRPETGTGDEPKAEKDGEESEKERARRLSGEAPLPRRTDKKGGI